MVISMQSGFQNQVNDKNKLSRKNILSKEESRAILDTDFGSNFPENVHDVVKKLYSRRNEKGEAIESLCQVWKRVSLSVGIGQIKYLLKPFEVIQLNLDKVLNNEYVLSAAAKYYKAMGERKMFANTPANINAREDISLFVLQYEAHGEILGWSTHKIWMLENELRQKYEKAHRAEKDKIKKWLSDIKGNNQNGSHGQQKLFYPNVIETLKHELAMGYYATKIKRKGGLAACGVTNAGDSLEEIEKAATEIMDATKGSMGMGINTTSIRPWQTPNSDGSTASGPDRFVEKLFCPAGQSIAQGGRRGGAFIELRDSNHPDITLFIDKKHLPKEPNFPEIYSRIDNGTELSENKKQRDLTVMQKALEEFSKLSYEYHSKQQYLKNYNISVRAVPGFMQAVEMKEWYPAIFGGSLWKGNVYDFTKPVLNSTGEQKVNPLNKELLYELYSINLDEFPSAEESAKIKGFQILKSDDGKLIQVKKDGAYCFYAPDIFKRICIGMVNGGEPGLQFAEHVEAANANKHIYELNTCNPCGEQNLPAQIGKDGLEYRGICNLTTIHAAHPDFFDENGKYVFEKMEEIAELSTEFMDDVTTVSHFPIPTQNSTARRERRNGGGFAGVAELIARYEIEFGSEKSNKLVEDLYNRFAKACISASERLATERGVYEIWSGSTYSQKGLRVRNSCMINQQPTGTMAQLCGTSWGPEPFNGIIFSRKVRDAWVNFTAPGFEEAMKKACAWPSTEEEVKNLLTKIRENGKKVTGLSEVPEQVQKIFKINTEIDPYDYINHLAAIQKANANVPECFNALSNTCMINGDINFEYAWEATMLAYKSGVKSITFYPDGTRLSQPVEAQEKKANELTMLEKFLPTKDISSVSITDNEAASILQIEENEPQIKKIIIEKDSKPRVRPKRMFGFNEEMMTPEGPLHVHVYFDEKGPRQIFAHLMRSGGIASGMIEAMCRMATKALKWGCPPEDVASGLVNIQGGQKIVGIEANSIPDAIGRVLRDACKGQYQMSLFAETSDVKSDDDVQTMLQKKHEIKFDETPINENHETNIPLLDDVVKARMDWIAQGHETQCPCCHLEFTAEAFGNPACKNGPVCLSCGWSHCG